MLLAFDFDGVISDSLALHLSLIDEIRKEFHAPRAPRLEDIPNLQNLTFRSFGSHLGVPEDLLDTFEGKILSTLMQQQSAPPIFPGMAQCLDTLAREHTILIITANVQKQVELSLRDVIPMPRILDATAPGNKAVKLAQGLEEFGYDIDEAIMIGDAASDIRAGKELGARTVAVTWGFFPESALALENPDQIVRSPKELTQTLLAMTAPSGMALFR